MTATTGQTVSRNVVILLLRQVVTWASTFILLMFLPRYLGPVDYGKFYLGQSIVAMFSLLIDFGGHFSITKAVSRARHDVGSIMVDALAIRSVLWAGSFIAVNAYALSVGYDGTIRIIIFIFSVGMTWTASRAVLWNCYQGFELMKYPAYATIAETAFIAGVGVAALVLGIGPIGFTVVTVLGTLLNFAISARFASSMVTSLPRVNWAKARAQLRDGFPYFLNSVFGIIYYRIDTVMLSLMVPKAVVGWYGASYRFFDSLMFAPSIVTIAIYPVLSRLWGEGSASVGRSVQKSLDFMFILGIPMSIGVFAFSREIIGLFYGIDQYQPSVLLLMIFAAGMMLVYIDTMLGTALLASDKQRQLSIISFSAVVINIGLNLLLIPFAQERMNNGGIGSAIATFGTELVVMIAMVGLLWRPILSQCRITAQVKTLVSGAAMGGALWFAVPGDWHWVVRATIAGTVYLVVLFALRTLEPSDLALIKHVVTRRTKNSENAGAVEEALRRESEAQKKGMSK